MVEEMDGSIVDCRILGYYKNTQNDVYVINSDIQNFDIAVV